MCHPGESLHSRECIYVCWHNLLQKGCGSSCKSDSRRHPCHRAVTYACCYVNRMTFSLLCSLHGQATPVILLHCVPLQTADELHQWFAKLHMRYYVLLVGFSTIQLLRSWIHHHRPAVMVLHVLFTCRGRPPDFIGYYYGEEELFKRHHNMSLA